MSWGQVSVGGIVFRETINGSWSNGALTITGQESHPPQSRAEVIAAHDNIVAAARQAAEDGLVTAVTFTDKVNLSGFYELASAQSELQRIHNGEMQGATWQMTLVPLGSERDLEVESRLLSIARTTELVGVTPVFWQAPAPAFESYYTGATVPSGSVSRQSSEGLVAVQLGIPSTPAPRWTVKAADYLGASSRLLFDSLRRIGWDSPPLSVWEMNNGIAQVLAGASGAFQVAAWGGAAWESPKSYQLTVNGTPITSTPELTVLRNDPEQTTVRLVYPVGVGRVTCDLGLRRGSRFVTGVVKRHSAATLGITRTAAEAATVVTGGLRATSADADGNRFVLGSSRTVTTTTATASIAKAAQTQLDFFAGHEFGSAPATGDAFADLLAQYLGASTERVRIVRR
jgi:hypothetical protein